MLNNGLSSFVSQEFLNIEYEKTSKKTCRKQHVICVACMYIIPEYHIQYFRGNDVCNELLKAP